MKRRLATIALQLWLPVTLLVYWWWRTVEESTFYVPAPAEVWDAISRNWLFDRVPTDLVPSLELFVIGYLLAALVGIALGTVLGMWRTGLRAVRPLVDFVRAIPAPALISVMIIFLGFTFQMRLAVVVITSTFPVLLHTIDGIRGVPAGMLEMATAYRIPRRDRIFRILLPAASPHIFAGLRISLSVALAVMVFAEMLGGTEGLGYFIFFAQETYEVNNMWSGIVVLGLIGYFVNLVFLFVEGRVMSWHRGQQEAGS